MFIKEITQDLIDSIDLFKAHPHKHDFDEMYLMIGDPSAITFEVLLDKERFEVSSPGAVYIPEGLPHGIRPIKASVGLSGGLIPICLNGEYKTISIWV